MTKSVIFGEYANRGRIIATLGRSGAWFDPELVDIAFDEVLMVKGGLGQGHEIEAAATAVLKKADLACFLIGIRRATSIKQ